MLTVNLKRKIDRIIEQNGSTIILFKFLWKNFKAMVSRLIDRDRKYFDI
jgi:hypothetical protein